MAQAVDDVKNKAGTNIAVRFPLSTPVADTQGFRLPSSSVIRWGGMEQGPDRGKLVAYYGAVTFFLVIFLGLLVSDLFFAVPISKSFVMPTTMAFVGMAYTFRKTYPAYFVQAVRLRMYSLVAILLAGTDFVLSLKI